MKTGTSHFPSYGAAMRYYRPYLIQSVNLNDGESRARFANQPGEQLKQWIAQKLNAGEISIGRPALKPGETLSIEDNRYFINSPSNAL